MLDGREKRRRKERQVSDYLCILLASCSSARWLPRRRTLSCMSGMCRRASPAAGVEHAATYSVRERADDVAQNDATIDVNSIKVDLIWRFSGRSH
eukprot:8772188-Pyramimonas_sp.AAC.1